MNLSKILKNIELPQTIKEKLTEQGEIDHIYYEKLEKELMKQIKIITTTIMNEINDKFLEELEKGNIKEKEIFNYFSKKLNKRNIKNSEIYAALLTKKIFNLKKISEKDLNNLIKLGTAITLGNNIVNLNRILENNNLEQNDKIKNILKNTFIYLIIFKEINLDDIKPDNIITIKKQILEKIKQIWNELNIKNGKIPNFYNDKVKEEIKQFYSSTIFLFGFINEIYSKDIRNENQKLINNALKNIQNKNIKELIEKNKEELINLSKKELINILKKIKETNDINIIENIINNKKQKINKYKNLKLS